MFYEHLELIIGLPTKKRGSFMVIIDGMGVLYLLNLPPVSPLPSIVNSSVDVIEAIKEAIILRSSITCHNIHAH